MIGLFGGTFDPPHNGHVNLALELKEKCNLSEVWVIPAQCSPFRSPDKTLSPIHRLSMCERAFSGIEGFKVLDLELRREGVSFTIDTISTLVKLFPEKKYALLLGEDAAFTFPQWKNAEEILKMVTVYVGRRRGEHIFEEQLKKILIPKEIEDVLLNGYVKTTYIEIEATRVRNRIQNRLYCKHLVPPKVLDYIYEHELYFNG